MDHDADWQTIDAKRAKRMGLADRCVPPRVMLQAAHKFVLPDEAPPFTFCSTPDERNPLKGCCGKWRLQGKRQKARKEHYPAPTPLFIFGKI